MAAVTNEELRIANTTLPHREQNLGTDDQNYKPDKSIHPHLNYGPLNEAIGKTSDKTKFEGGNVVRVDDKVTTHDDHPGVLGGVSTGTYLFPSWATQGAPNVRAEGGIPTRDTDPTKQNNGNSDGQVMDPNDAENIKKKLEERVKRCSLEKIEKAQCDHDREATEARILEITASAESPALVKLKAVRTNAVEPGPAKCFRGEKFHTEWVISRKKGGGLDEKDDKKNGDEIELDAEWWSETEAEVETEQGDANEKADEKAKKDADRAAKRKAQRDRARQIHERSKEMRRQEPNRPGSVVRAKEEWERGQGAAYEKAHSDKIKNTRQRTKQAGEAYDKAVEIGEFLKCWFWRKDPVRVTVQGQACSGSESLEFLAFPADEVEWKLGEAEKSLVKGATAAINKISDFITGLLAPIGDVEVEVKILEGANVTLEIQWLELTRDAPNAGLKKYQCNKRIQLQFNIDDIFFLKVKLNCPLARVLDFLIPGAGWVVQKIVNWFGLRAQAYISIEAGVGIRFALTLDEYWEGVAPSVSILPKFKVAIGLELKFRDNLHIWGEAAAKWEPEFNNAQFDKDAVLRFDLAEGSVDIGFEGGIYASFMWFEINRTGTFYPESWKFKYGTQTLRPLAPVMALVKN